MGRQSLLQGIFLTPDLTQISCIADILYRLSYQSNMEFQAPVNMQDGLMGLSALTSLQDALNGIPLKIEASGETEGAVGSTSFQKQWQK